MKRMIIRVGSAILLAQFDAMKWEAKSGHLSEKSQQHRVQLSSIGSAPLELDWIELS